LAKIPSDRARRRHWLLALGLTLAHGLLWWALTPPWAAPDEPGHYLYARLLADLGRAPTLADLSPAVEAPLLASLVAHEWWAYNGRPQPPAPPARWQDDPTLAASGNQFENEPLLFYLLPAWWLRQAGERFGADPAAALRWLRLWPLLLRLLAVAAALALAQRTWPQQPHRWLSVGLLMGLLPMVGFIGGSFNNAALALAWGAVAFWALARHPRLALILILLGPLLADLSLLFLWPLAAGLGLWRLQRRQPRLAAALIAGLALILLLLCLPQPGWAAGWRRSPGDMISRAGGGGLALQPQPGDTHALSQIIAGKELAALSGQTLRLRAEVLTQPRPALRLTWQDAAAAVEQVCSESVCDFSIPIPAHPTFLRIAAAAAQPMTFRLALTDAAGRQLLDNGDGRWPAPRGSTLFRSLEQRLPVPAGFFERLYAPATWDAAAQFRYLLFGGFTWASFWGFFGWLSRPLPWWIYLLLAAANALAGWGLLHGLPAAVRRRRSPSSGDRLLLLAALALLLILAQVWAPMLGQAWQPQGRYLFPALLPIALLLAAGWEQALPPAHRDRLPPLLVILLTALNLTALFGVSY